MFKNLNKKKIKPNRVVIFGSGGFIGKNLKDSLENENINVVGISTKDIDLIKRDSVCQIKDLIKENDNVVFLSALTPDKGKDLNTYKKNIEMINNLISGIYEKKLNHFLYFSSDAVYSFDNSLINEKTPIYPSDYYSLMHITRELIIKNEVKSPFLLLRPTAVFGFGDTHNSYGPNRFINNAIFEKKIILGGEGEETRDHIFINDLINLTVLCILYKSAGILNAASGFSISFMELAKLVKENLPDIEIKTTQRNNPITYRSFNIDCLNSNLTLPFSKIDDCIKQYIRKLVN